jgi:hypothetical protein
MTLKQAIVVLIGSIIGALCHADNVTSERWDVNGKSFDSKAMAVRYIIASGQELEVTHTRCEILTNKLTFKACPKNKKSSFESEQFKSITATK